MAFSWISSIGMRVFITWMHVFIMKSRGGFCLYIFHGVDHETYLKEVETLNTLDLSIPVTLQYAIAAVHAPQHDEYYSCNCAMAMPLGRISNARSTSFDHRCVCSMATELKALQKGWIMTSSDGRLTA